MISPTYPEEYLDIDFLSEVMFDYLYGDKSTQKCYELDQIDFTDFNINNIKLVLDRLKQKQLVNNIFNAKLTWQWRKNNLYTFKRQMSVYSTNVQIKLVSDYENVNSLKSSENINSLATFFLSDLVVTKKTKGILLNLMNFDIALDLLNDFLDNYQELYVDFKDIPDKKNKLVNITVYEHFFKTDILSEIANNLTWQQLESIIFQVAHTLALIQNEFPGFRKNNLTCDTILLYNKKPKKNLYKLGSKEYTVSDKGYEVKLGFFSDTYIPKYIENDNLSESKKTLDNTWDLLMFLNDLKQIIISKEIKENIKKIIENIEKNGKNIILSNIIMNLSIQNGGKNKTNKSRTIKGVRYLSNDNSVFLKSKSRNIEDLPDSLSSLDSISSGGSYKYSETNKMGQSKMNQMQMNQMQMNQMPLEMNQMPMGMNQMPMSMNQMPMGMNGLSQVNPLAMNQMGQRTTFGSESIDLNSGVTNDQLVKLGIMPPSSAMANLPRSAADRMSMGQMGGSSSIEEFININGSTKSNFFF
jgi:hypothetical protein